jgi:hypothetical protein
MRLCIVPVCGGVGVFARSDDHAVGLERSLTRSVEAPRILISSLPLALWTSGARQSEATKRRARAERDGAKALHIAGA